MERFLPSSCSPMANTPVCDSDEEIFFGPVTEKELQKASTLKRRTQFYFPSFNWKPSVSPLARHCGISSEDKDTDGKAAAVGVKPTEECDPSHSQDSLETPSYVTVSDKPEDSSKAEFWSACSGDSSHAASQFSLNNAVIHSKFSEDSLESENLGSGTDSLDVPKLYSNISADSLDDNSSQDENQKNNHKAALSNMSVICDEPSLGAKRLSTKRGAMMNETYSASESSAHDESVQCLTAPLTTSVESCTPVPAKPSEDTDQGLRDFEKNVTYTADDSCLNDEHCADTDASKTTPEGDVVDRDGGYLSILSEAALYHAAQSIPKEQPQPHVFEISSSTTQSLEDRFKDFGINAAELEDQQLSTSIMYETGRESNVLSSGAETNTFYTGRNSGGISSSGSSVLPSCLTTQGNLGDISSISSLNSRKNPYECGTGQVNITGESQESSTGGMHQSDVLNQPIMNGTLGSAGLALQDTSEEDSSYRQKVHDDFGTVDSSYYAEESSDISGVHELHSGVEDHMKEKPAFNDSGASSYAGEMNDTLEEYEMMMRYGVDYILGQKGGKGKNDDGIESMPTAQSPMKYGTHNRSSLMGTSSALHLDGKQNPYVNLVGSVEPKNVSSSPKKLAGAQTRKILSPLRRQASNYTPIKSPAPNPTSLSAQKRQTKLPRVASVTPSKMPQTMSKILQTPPQPVKQQKHVTPTSEKKTSCKSASQPVTPSSETKFGVFKKPINPAVPVSRIPKAPAASTPGSKSNMKVLEKIQSPVSAYIHHTPSPVLVTNVKAKTTDLPSHEKEMHARAVWRSKEIKSNSARPGCGQGSNAENMNPNIGCGLPAVKYTKAPCIKLDETSKIPVPRAGEKITKLMEMPSPQVIKHEGRLRVNCGSPQLAAKMQSMAESIDDSMVDVHSISGDISVCVSKQACRTNTLGH